VIPVETRSVAPPALDDLKALIQTAVGKRPELKNLKLRLESNEYQKDLAKNLQLPGVNLAAGYTMAGLAGARNTARNPFFGGSVGDGVPAAFVGGYGTTLSSLFGQNYTSWQAGLQIDWTVRNRAAAETLAQANIADRNLNLQRAKAEQIIEAEVRNSMQSLRTSEQRIVAAEASVKAAKEKLDSEQRLFETGESTNFLVLTRQNEYADSQRRSLVARLDFNKAIARLEQAIGSTLDTHSISLK
jgi:outer membrane protein TolC